MRKKSLQSLKSLAHGKETRWQRHVANQLRTLQHEQQRLAQLRGYLQEYVQPNPNSLSHNILSIRSRQQFVDRLRVAVAQQQQTVADQQVATDRGKERWRQARSRHLALQKFGERQMFEENRQRDRRDQAVLDETGRNQFLARLKS